MTPVDRWLLPDGIEEILPNRAYRVERLRRRLLDLYHAWGYDLVIPPLAEFTESLLSGSGSDLDLMTFKITDQLSGRMMGVRADITPQAARMDAHSLRRQGPNRLCYAGQVLYTRPRGVLQSRSPIQIGVELFGEPGLAADVEVVGLLIDTLHQAGINKIHLDLGHVGIYRGLEAGAGLNAGQEAELFDLLQRKDSGLTAWLKTNVADSGIVAILAALPDLAGGVSVLARARAAFTGAPAAVHAALDELALVVAQVQAATPAIDIYLDLSELRGYHYHTGIVFAAYSSLNPIAIGNGGRYDHVGEAFGRARPATGFGVDLGLLAALVEDVDTTPAGIFAPASDDRAMDAEIRRLRAAGERVVAGFRGQIADYTELHCDRVLAASANGFIVKTIGD
ncbi:MAG: ATP phosphoribosyltransferase regulatory subunit [Porticoccaceae bacterium]